MSIFSSYWGRAIGACFLSIAMLAAAPWALGTANAQQNSPSPLAGEGRGEGAKNNVSFDIPAQNLATALTEFARQSNQELFYLPEMAEGKTTEGVTGTMTTAAAMDALLEGTGLEFEPTPNGSLLIGDRATLDARRAEWQSSAAGQQQNTIGQRRPGIEEIIVTGQKKEERIQDVPIAISAFSQEDLRVSQIAGGPDLHLQVPNMTFTKTNFTGYSIQIRGIGTQAISATTDPAVAVALNNTPFIRNNFFEQEFYDLERLEVLRGPQGTLYGRNATAGVVNLITAKPKFQKEAMLSLDKGNYNSRRWEFMLNQPLVDDTVALRIAGAGTKRDGYATNELTDSPIDGRDLWSTRVSVRIAPTDANFDLNLMWERFEEDDDRIRSGKQLCHKHIVEEMAGVEADYFDRVADYGQTGTLFTGVQGTFSQGCERGSLYSDNAFQTPNGLMLPYYQPLAAIGLKAGLADPYASAVQSKDLRVIESIIDPEYRAKSDIGQIQLQVELTDTLLLDSETAYANHSIFSLQDFNRFNTSPGAWVDPEDFSTGQPVREDILQSGPNGGVFCDPQLGCSDRLVAADVSSAESEQFSQEFRLSSQFDGPFNFSLGANYLRYDTVDKFYVFSNSFTMAASDVSLLRHVPWVPGVSDNSECLANGFAPHDPTTVADLLSERCWYVDPNPIGELNDQGHNYFLSKNPYELTSYGIFGETYWNLTDTLKLTAGLRWSVDEKKAPLIPSQLFAVQSVGHPTAETLNLTWREPTGRLVLDWQPTLDFTDETLIYGSYSHGYKAGGANPPPYRKIVRAHVEVGEILQQRSVLAPQTFDAEFVDAFEIGTKNTLADGAVTFNLAAFYYDYEGYQISEIVDRSAFNRNYDLEVWGAELETDWWVRENLRLGFKGGYQKTRIADGERAVDLMDRTAGGKHFMITDIVNPNFDPDQAVPESEYVAARNLDEIPVGQEFFAFEDWTIVRPFPTFPSSCVLPSYLFFDSQPRLGDGIVGASPSTSGPSGGSEGACEWAFVYGADPQTGEDYVPDPGIGNAIGDPHAYPGFNPEWSPNNGEGFFKDLGGNELPNAPNYTATLTADYVVPLAGDWMATWHTDLYWQSESWWRIFNDHEFNRLDDYFTMNVAAIFQNEMSGWEIMAYVKNVTDEDAITGAFLYSDDVGLTTNAFLVEPRLYGVRVTKEWDGSNPGSRLFGAVGGLLGREPGQPSPWSLELGGYLLRPNEAPAETYRPSFITAFDPNIDLTGEQVGDMDWGDGREIVLTYAPENGWRFSLGARWGETSREKRADALGDITEGCPGKYDMCHGGYVLPPPFPPITYEYDLYSRQNYAVTELAEVEEHTLVDFTVGRDVGLGGFAEGTLSAGLRYANFTSRTDAMVRGTPNWQMPDECAHTCYDLSTFATYYNPTTRTEYVGTMEAEREFKGVGPTVAWEASSRLLGDDSGHLDLDWSITGGVLFGKQKTTAEGTEEEQYFSQPYQIQLGLNKTTPIDSNPVSSSSTDFRHERDDDRVATVPTLGGELGLTYRINGASIGAGYRWERYYGVIDGGVEERRSYDRTIDGPYLKVTFGGGS